MRSDNVIWLYRRWRQRREGRGGRGGGGEGRKRGRRKEEEEGGGELKRHLDFPKKKKLIQKRKNSTSHFRLNSGYP